MARSAPQIYRTRTDFVVSGLGTLIELSFPQFGESAARPPHRRLPSEMSEAEAKPEGEEGEEKEEMTEEEKLIAAMPHPGREGSSSLTAKHWRPPMSGVEAFEARAEEAERRIALLEDRLKDAQLPGHYERLSMVKNPAPGDSLLKQRVMHQMLDLRKSLRRARGWTRCSSAKPRRRRSKRTPNWRRRTRSSSTRSHTSRDTSRRAPSAATGTITIRAPADSMVVRDKVDHLVNPPPEPEDREGGDGEQQ